MPIETSSFRQASRSFAESETENSGRTTPAEVDGVSNHRPETKPGQRRILIVQGDWEAGMSRLALDLMDAGHYVGKVIFCAPDLIYRIRGVPTHTFRKPIGGFDEWLRELVRTEGYDTFFLYNHYRPYNQLAWNLAAELNLGCHVFELGLIRPNCVMVFSRNQVPLAAIPKAWQSILAGDTVPPQAGMPPQLCQVRTPVKLALFCANFIFSRITSPLFPNFVDQRDMKLGKHLKHGAIHLWRLFERSRDHEYDPLFAGEWSGTYYAVPLQVHSDTQILRCSDFDSIEDFIRMVVSSFMKHAPADTKLVFKVHPMDRGYKDYTDLILALDHHHGGGRIVYVDRVHLPTLLEHSRGVVNVNSSVGISGLVHQVPVIALGMAVYDLPELTFRGKLDDFWTMSESPKGQRVRQFINLLLATNQGRGTLSQRCFDVPGRCRIQWPAPFEQEFFPDRSSSPRVPSTEDAGHES
jgi:capsular polysaccharide export protein